MDLEIMWMFCVRCVVLLSCLMVVLVVCVWFWFGVFVC